MPTRGEIQPRCLIWTTQNPHFPGACERPFKVVELISEEMRHDADIRLIVWPRGRRDCYKQPPTCACIHVKYEN